MVEDIGDGVVRPRAVNRSEAPEQIVGEGGGSGSDRGTRVLDLLVNPPPGIVFIVHRILAGNIIQFPVMLILKGGDLIATISMAANFASAVGRSSFVAENLFGKILVDLFLQLVRLIVNPLRQLPFWVG